MVGCSSSPTFSISPIGDKFTNPNQPKGFVGDGNRLSNKSSMGGVHIDKKGVYINPYVFKNDGGVGAGATLGAGEFVDGAAQLGYNLSVGSDFLPTEAPTSGR